MSNESSPAATQTADDALTEYLKSNAAILIQGDKLPESARTAYVMCLAVNALVQLETLTEGNVDARYHALKMLRMVFRQTFGLTLAPAS